MTPGRLAEIRARSLHRRGGYHRHRLRYYMTLNRSTAPAVVFARALRDRERLLEANERRFRARCVTVAARLRAEGVGRG